MLRPMPVEAVYKVVVTDICMLTLYRRTATPLLRGTWLVLTRPQCTAASQSSTLMRSTSSSLLLTKQSPVYSWLHVESLIVNILDGDNATFSDVYWTPDNKSTVSFSKRDKSVSLSLYVTSFRSDCCWSRVSPKAIGKVTTYYINIQRCCSCLSASFLHVLNHKIRVLGRTGKT